jgi:hypothetical protein
MDKESSSVLDFSEYLKSKKIDPVAFKKGDEIRFNEFKNLFDQVHPNSFTQQKLFLINKIRRKYILSETATETSAPAPKKLKPKIFTKPKLS